ncbi:uncharacterized protein LOC143298157 [Babylonia areolata]|uniref:uncharacterized protein LOC143298157 n=1 Tax=Babylonia areolata TaxID=304850 RepID=UPI003FD448F4
MAVFSSRPLLYKIGLVGLLASSLLYLIGFSSPYWVTVDSGRFRSSSGLWMACIADVCANLGVANLYMWFHITRFLETVGLLILMLTCGYDLLANFLLKASTYSKNLEVLAIVGGLLAFSGAMVFVGKFHDLELYSYYPSNRKLSWALILASIGSAGAFVSAIIVTVSNNATPNTSQQGVVVQQHQLQHQQQQQPAGAFQGVVVQDGRMIASPQPYGYGVTTAPVGGTAVVYHVPSPPPQQQEAGYSASIPLQTATATHLPSKV